MAENDRADLQARIERMEVQLAAARKLDIDYATARRFEIGSFASNPGSIFDRHGALTIALAIILQTAGAIWWASGINQEIKQITDSDMKRDMAIAKISDLLQSNADRLTKVQTVQENVVKILDELSRREMRGPNQ